jgi:hypothetical protein
MAPFAKMTSRTRSRALNIQQFFSFVHRTIADTTRIFANDQNAVDVCVRRMDALLTQVRRMESDVLPANMSTFKDLLQQCQVSLWVLISLYRISLVKRVCINLQYCPIFLYNTLLDSYWCGLSDHYSGRRQYWYYRPGGRVSGSSESLDLCITHNYNIIILRKSTQFLAVYIMYISSQLKLCVISVCYWVI